MPTASERASLVEQAKQKGLKPVLSPSSATGYAGVGILKGKYQARFYDKARGKQRAVPGLYETALEAALVLALAKAMVHAMEEGETLPSPAKRKTRLPARTVPIMPMALAIPVEAASPRMPLASVQPVAGGMVVGMAGPVASVWSGEAYTPPAAWEVADIA